MADQRDDMFRVKPSPPKGAGRATERSFLSRVAMEMGKGAGIHGRGLRGARGRGAKRGLGWVTARLMDTKPEPRARRVIVKTRLVVFKQAGSRSAATHLRYLVREGVGRDGEPGQAYSGDLDAADVKAFEERSHGDRHQFRFIVAPEDAVELEDLRAFTRELMSRLERDLGTKLEWVAADHWDTDNPHTHVVLRGKDQAGENLVIGREYISHGMRTRAGEVATEWLGPRTDLEIRASLQRDVDQQRWTGLDRKLHALSKDGVISVAADLPRGDNLRHRALLIGRLQRLHAMGLARQLEPGTWELREDSQIVLQQLGERGDIIRTMQRTFGSQGREFAMVSEAWRGPIVGRIAAKGLAGELHDKPYLVIDGLDGRGHYVYLPNATDVADLPVGGIVEVRAGVESAADRNIAATAQNGCYVRREHVRQLRSAGRSQGEAEVIVEGHIRRLEALRRAGIVERISDGVWRVPGNLIERGRAQDRARRGDISLKLHSHLPIEKQIQAIGATWLDRQLLDPPISNHAAGGFAVAARDAIEARVDFLVKEGLAERRNKKIVFAANLLGTLRNRELESAAKSIATDTGLLHRPVTEGNTVSGVYRGSVMLASGRFAMLSDGLGFSLVPWRPVIESALGRSISAVMRGGNVDWRLGRQRGIAI